MASHFGDGKKKKRNKKKAITDEELKGQADG